MQTAVVTGGAGFLGSHLCDKLLSEGLKVICIDNLITGNVDNIAHLAGNENFSFIKHDITNYSFIQGKVDYTLHFASPERFGLDRKTVRRWRDTYRQAGVDGLVPRYPAQRASRLTPEVRELIRQARQERRHGAPRAQLWLERVHQVLNRTRFPWRPSSLILASTKEGGHGKETGSNAPTRTHVGTARLPERWSVQRKQEIVLRLLRGESLDQVSRETQVPAHELEAWQRRFLQDRQGAQDPAQPHDPTRPVLAVHAHVQGGVVESQQHRLRAGERAERGRGGKLDHQGHVHELRRDRELPGVEGVVRRHPGERRSSPSRG